MNRTARVDVQKIVISALLCAIGIVIPMFSPIKLVLEPASFTLASHVAIFIAMFLSPGCAVAVSLGTTIGFALGGFPIVIVMRALTHVVFATMGAVYLQKFPGTLTSLPKAAVFSLLLSVVHSACEVFVVMPFYFGNAMTASYYTKGFVQSVVILVGVGGVIHSLVDFAIALLIWKPLSKTITLRSKVAGVS